MMQAILINGSCNQMGDTHKMLSIVEGHLAKDGADVELVHAAALLADLDPPYCTDCGDDCAGSCYAGTALEGFFSRLAGADIVIAGSPVYFGTVSAPLKGMWDLTRTLRKEKSLLYTVGAAMSVGGGRFGGQETTVRAIHDMMFIQGMIIVGDSNSESIGHQGVCATTGVDTAAEERLKVLSRAVIDVGAATMTLRSSNRHG